MEDFLSAIERSKRMSLIRKKDTKPELMSESPSSPASSRKPAPYATVATGTATASAAII